MKTRADDNLGYWLFYTQRRVAHAFAEVLRQCCVEHGKQYVVTPSQFGVLTALAYMDDVTIGSISQQRGLDAPTITGIVKRLEQSGLVKRIHDRIDRRVVKVCLTEEGRTIINALGSPVDAFNDVLIQGFSETEQSALLTDLHRIIANVEASAPDITERFEPLPKDLSCEQ